ncbi:hypothetical protein ACGFIE_20170 [Micromonospora sp. NPDC049275]|uniref:hypothetical protein n=1 Tax=Micromonospora sp. NPDC049275 TaxID=3364268 RepID=UPI00371EBDA3
MADNYSEAATSDEVSLDAEVSDRLGGSMSSPPHPTLRTLSMAAGLTVFMSLFTGCTAGEQGQRDPEAPGAAASVDAACGKSAELPDESILKEREIWKSGDGTFGRSVSFVSLPKGICEVGSPTALERFDCQVFPWSATTDRDESLFALGASRWGSVTYENKGGASIVREYIFTYEAGSKFPEIYRQAARHCGATTNVTVNGKPSDLLMISGDTQRLLIVDEWHIVAVESKRGDETVKPVAEIASAALHNSLILR